MIPEAFGSSITLQRKVPVPSPSHQLSTAVFWLGVPG